VPSATFVSEQLVAVMRLLALVPQAALVVLLDVLVRVA